MKCYKNDIYPISLVVSRDVASVNDEYYNPTDGIGEDIRVREHAEACTMPLTERGEGSRAMAVGIIFNKSAILVRTMAHEAFHATKMMMDMGLGCPLDDSSEEAWAYLIGWIAGCIADFAKDSSNG